MLKNLLSRKTEIKLGFTLMLVEELAREALSRLYLGQHVPWMQANITAQPPEEFRVGDRIPFEATGPIRDYDYRMKDRRGADPTITEFEMKLGENARVQERYVFIEAIIRPASEGMLRTANNMPKISVACRLFSTNGRTWHPHFMNLTIAGVVATYTYKPGWIGGMHSTDCRYDGAQPFDLMVADQHSLHLATDPSVGPPDDFRSHHLD